MSQDLLKTQAEQIAALRGQRDVEGSNYTLAQRLHWCAISWRDDAPALSALLDEARAALSAPEAPTQPGPQALTIERLRDALVASRIIDPGAVEDPNNYDDGVMLARIEALYRRLAEQLAPKPLTERELELIDGMIEVQLHHAAQCDLMLARAGGNHTMAERQKGWDMERVALLRKLGGLGA